MLTTAATPLSRDLLSRIDAYWRAANYLSVGQIYLYDNPLLREPLTTKHIKPRLLGHFGTKDEGIPIDSVKAMAATLDRLKKRETVEFYDAGHGFSNSSGRNYNAAAADQAWARTIAFYKKELGS